MRALAAPEVIAFRLVPAQCVARLFPGHRSGAGSRSPVRLRPDPCCRCLAEDSRRDLRFAAPNPGPGVLGEKCNLRLISQSAARLFSVRLVRFAYSQYTVLEIS